MAYSYPILLCFFFNCVRLFLNDFQLLRRKYEVFLYVKQRISADEQSLIVPNETKEEQKDYKKKNKNRKNRRGRRGIKEL